MNVILLRRLHKNLIGMHKAVLYKVNEVFEVYEYKYGTKFQLARIQYTSTILSNQIDYHKYGYIQIQDYVFNASFNLLIPFLDHVLQKDTPTIPWKFSHKNLKPIDDDLITQITIQNSTH